MRKTGFWKTDGFLGVVVSLLMLAAAGTDLVRSLERKAYDLGVQASSRTPLDRVAVIAIDDASIANLGRWPWPRDRLAKMTDLLAEGKAMVYDRYDRNLGTIGLAGQEKLAAAKVAVIGAGGLGGLVIELLARMGVGYLRIIDGDTFAAHNLNRQLLATENNLNQGKAQAAVARVAAINSDVTAEAVTISEAFCKKSVQPKIPEYNTCKSASVLPTAFR